MLLYKKKNTMMKGNRFLINVTVLGSAGPIRFVVNEDDTVASVISTALKVYAREGRLPVLGSNSDDFFLYCPNTSSFSLNPWETIGSFGARNFMLCNKPKPMVITEGQGSNGALGQKGSGSWKSWINKSLNLKISSH